MANKTNKIKDFIGTVYQLLLQLMVLAQITFIYYEYKANNYFFIVLHVLICFYFLFRLYVFVQMKQTAHNDGKTLIEYLDEIKNCR